MGCASQRHTDRAFRTRTRCGVGRMPVHNVGTFLKDQLDALARQDLTEPWGLVMSDNGSSNASVAVARAAAERFHCL